MRLMLVTDAWMPQVNGVVTTLVQLTQQLRSLGHVVEVMHPGLFKTRPCPGYAGIDLAVRPGKQAAQILRDSQPDAVHIATEGPLGWAARNFCLKMGWPFTTAYHTRFPELLHAALRVPLALSYLVMRRFHAPSSAVLVPTKGVLRLLDRQGFRNLREWTHGVDVHLFRYSDKPVMAPALQDLKHPIALCVCRVSYEKNLESFLRMPWSGSKVVAGDGPLLKNLKERYPHVRWLGLVPHDELPAIYASAHVFAFPSRHETFGLVMLEAMSCGTPVAAYPVDGPLEVLGNGYDRSSARGGIMFEDLQDACQLAMRVPRHEARSRALQFSWEWASIRFLDLLVSIPAALKAPDRDSQSSLTVMKTSQ
jgi:glycosyltransferase involved in cell wall biosynthesis